MKQKAFPRALDLLPARATLLTEVEAEDHEVRLSQDMIIAVIKMMKNRGVMLSAWSTPMMQRSTVETTPAVKWAEVLVCKAPMSRISYRFKYQRGEGVSFVSSGSRGEQSSEVRGEDQLRRGIKWASSGAGRGRRIHEPLRGFQRRLRRLSRE